MKFLQVLIGGDSCIADRISPKSGGFIGLSAIRRPETWLHLSSSDPTIRGVSARLERFSRKVSLELALFTSFGDLGSLDSVEGLGS